MHTRTHKPPRTCIYVYSWIQTCDDYVTSWVVWGHNAFILTRAHTVATEATLYIIGVYAYKYTKNTHAHMQLHTDVFVVAGPANCNLTMKKVDDTPVRFQSQP